MKRFLAALALCLLLFTPVLACDEDSCRDDVGLLAWMPPYIAGAGVSGGVACSASTDYAGNKTHSTAANAPLGKGYINVIAFTSSCPSGCSSGTIDTFYMDHYNDPEASIEICVYEKTGANPKSTDALVGKSVTVTSSSSQDASGEAASNYTIACNTEYWVGIAVLTGSVNNWETSYNNTTGTMFYKSGFGDGCPNPLGSDITSNATSLLQVWVTIK